MKKTNFYISMLLIITGLAACDNSAETSTATTDSTTETTVTPGEGTVTTTTVTHTYTGNFIPKPNVKYIDLKTREKVTVRIDTVRGEVVNSETNEPIYLLVEPGTRDTIYGYTGSIVNNYIIRDESGDYRVDTIRMSSTETTSSSSDENTPEGDYKEKRKGDKHVIKTEDYKIKEKNGEIKKIKEK